jgi:hypothetical protein
MGKFKAKINKTAVRTKMHSGMKKKGRQISSEPERKVHQRVNAAFIRKRNELISNFNNHPVTKEIEAGASAANISGTLGGYGNLFTFIGFDAGSSPVSIVRSMLEFNTRLIRKPTVTVRKKSVSYSYRIKSPDMKQLDSASPMPWEPGSWLRRIEKGISGLGNYIYHTYIVPTSRSGKGTQSSREMRTAMYTRTIYMSAILKTFKTGWGRL